MSLRVWVISIKLQKAGSVELKVKEAASQALRQVEGGPQELAGQAGHLPPWAVGGQAAITATHCTHGGPRRGSHAVLTNELA